MTVDAIGELHEAKPFRPFDIVVAGGTRIRVPHPEFSTTPAGEEWSLHSSNEERFEFATYSS
jgi:N-methylhydantoinase A/oxoprolinase/acetone carboxylase beta subunit